MKTFYLVLAILLTMVSIIATFVNLAADKIHVSYIFAEFENPFIYTFLCHFVGFLTGILWSLFIREAMRQKQVDEVDF